VQWTAILNPRAGGRRADAITAALDARPDVTVTRPASIAAATALAHDAFSRQEGVVAVGGDGTFGVLSGPAAETGGVLALVPNGTGNDMARELGVPRRNPTAAIALLDHGHLATIDMGTITDATGARTWFPSVASIGFDAVANERANDIERLPGSARYLVAALRTLTRFRPVTFDLEIDDDRHETRVAWMIAVANASTYGGGMRIAPDARLADGRLDLITVGPVRRPQLLRQLPRVFRGRHIDHPSITVRHVERIRIASRDTNPLRCYASGDPAGVLPVEVAVVPRALRVVVPGTHPLAGAPIATDDTASR
jgi:diacylglycerol kinase (ATP)